MAADGFSEMSAALLCLCCITPAAAIIHDIDSYGAKRGEPLASFTNAAAFEAALKAARPGDTVLSSAGALPYYVHAFVAEGLRSVAVRVEGELRVDLSLIHI